MNLVVAGDFNYPKNDWEHSKTSSPNHLNYQFLECTRDCFLKVISESTCARGPSQPTLIVLVLNNNPDIINKVNPDAPLGKSDHSVEKTSNNKQDWTPIKYLNVLHHNRTQKQLWH